MRVVFDRRQCDSNGFCTQEAPEVFALDDNDQLHILVPEPPEHLRTAVSAAMRVCPKQAIRIEG
jgi:ferredoxin